MNYQSVYNQLIESRRNLGRTKRNGIFENHHIIPKSCGGTNEKSNLILLTPREHFITHLLLIHVYYNDVKLRYKMIHAAKWLITKRNGDVVKGARQYEYIKYHLRLTGVPRDIVERSANSRKGKPISEECKKKLSATLKARPLNPLNWAAWTQSAKGRPVSELTKKAISKANKGRIMSEEQKKKLSIALTGKKSSPTTSETRKKISNAHKGKKLTEEHKKKLSISHIGKKLTEEHKRNVANANKGKKQTKEAIEKRVSKMRGRTLSDEVKKQISEKLKGRKLTDEHKQNIIKNNGMHAKKLRKQNGTI